MFDIFAYLWEHCTRAKNDKQNDNFARIAKIAFFSKHCNFLSFLSPINGPDISRIFLRKLQQTTILQVAKMTRSIVIFCPHFSKWPIFLHIFEKSCTSNDKKWQILHQDKKWQKNCIFLEALSFFVIFLSFFKQFSIFFAYFFLEHCTRTTKERQNFHQMTKNLTNQNWHDKEKSDKKMTKDMTNKTEMTKKWPKNDKQNDRQNWNNKKHDKKRQTKWQTKLKWQKNNNKNDKKSTK